MPFDGKKKQKSFGECAPVTPIVSSDAKDAPRSSRPILEKLMII